MMPIAAAASIPGKLILFFFVFFFLMIVIYRKTSVMIPDRIALKIANPAVPISHFPSLSFLLMYGFISSVPGISQAFVCPTQYSSISSRSISYTIQTVFHAPVLNILMIQEHHIDSTVSDADSAERANRAPRNIPSMIIFAAITLIFSPSASGRFPQVILACHQNTTSHSSHPRQLPYVFLSGCHAWLRRSCDPAHRSQA